MGTGVGGGGRKVLVEDKEIEAGLVGSGEEKAAATLYYSCCLQQGGGEGLTRVEKVKGLERRGAVSFGENEGGVNLLDGKLCRMRMSPMLEFFEVGCVGV